jgi:hypothetical protein
MPERLADRVAAAVPVRVGEVAAEFRRPCRHGPGLDGTAAAAQNQRSPLSALSVAGM